MIVMRKTRLTKEKFNLKLLINRVILSTLIITQSTVCYGNEVKAFALKMNTIAAEEKPSNTQKDDLINRLRKLEPEIPTHMDTPYLERPFPSKMQTSKDVMLTGFQLPFRLILDEPHWKRPLYKEQWHSTYAGGRWSYMPLRLFYAQHRIFTTSAVGLSNMYDFLNNLGLSDLNVEQKGPSQEERVNEIVVVIMQAKIERVVSKGNQVLIVARPQRTGVQAITVNRLNMKPDKDLEATVFQLVTPDGDELDYSIY
ncbi:hypothetical protein [Paenibacillus dakarensis]|uniref:hypothetical protein n=1 Tax=Paenibacillus dakarensis TaxID=1527293 RepID=UPI0006D58D49|nr:hypothetical protein [Paenibacillus dakarensis]